MNEILSIFGIDFRLLLVQAFNFGILLVALWYFLYRPVIAMLEKRKHVIEQGVRDAEEAAHEKESVQEERSAIIKGATHEAETLVDAAKVRAEKESSAILGATQERSERMVEDARLKSEEERRQILEASKEEIARMVVLGAEKVMQKKG